MRSAALDALSSGRASAGAGPPWTLAWTQSSSARTASGRSSRPSGRMSHSVPRRTRKGASASLTRRSRAPGGGGRPRESAHDADSRRVVADRQVLVASARSRRAPSPRRSRSRPTRSYARAGRRGSARARPAAAARRETAAREAPAGRTGSRARGRRLLVACVRQRLERGDVLGRAGRADELGAEPGRRGDDELDRDALDRDPVATRLGTLEHRNDRRQRLERIEHGAGSSAGRRPRTARSSRGSAAGRRPGCRQAARRSPPGAAVHGGLESPAAAEARRRVRAARSFASLAGRFRVPR